MTRLLPLLALLAVLSLGAVPYPASEPPRARAHDGLSIYTVASLVTGAPESVLRGIAQAESTGGRYLNHLDPHDRGWFGLHETQAYHAERAGRWGEYDADDPGEAAIIAGWIYMDNLAHLGDGTLALAAYHQGVAGVQRDGMDAGYVERARR